MSKYSVFCAAGVVEVMAVNKVHISRSNVKPIHNTSVRHSCKQAGIDGVLLV